MIKKHFWLFILVILFGCENSKPTVEMVDAEIKRIDFIIKYTLGEDYFIREFKIRKEYFLDKMKKEYKMEYSFILNKQFIEKKPKRINGYLLFKRNLNKTWKCTYNTVEEIGIINLIN